MLENVLEKEPMWWNQELDQVPPKSKTNKKQKGCSFHILHIHSTHTQLFLFLTSIDYNLINVYACVSQPSTMLQPSCNFSCHLAIHFHSSGLTFVNTEKAISIIQ